MNERALRERSDELEEEVRQLKEALTPNLAWPSFLGVRMTGAARRVTAMLMARAPNIMPREILRMSCLHEDTTLKVVDVHIYKARRALSPCGVHIHVQWGEGFWMDNASAARLRELLKGAQP